MAAHGLRLVGFLVLGGERFGDGLAALVQPVLVGDQRDGEVTIAVSPARAVAGDAPE